MAAVALSQRELTAVKLDESVRQLRRYLDSGARSKRILEKKCEKLESEKDELIEDHHRYAHKSNTDLNDDAMKDFLVPKLDGAEDILNEAIDFLDNLNNEDSKENKKAEAATVKLQASMGEELIQYIMDESSKILLVETPSDDDVIRIENLLKELEKKEDEIKESFDVLGRLLEENEKEEFFKKETHLKCIISAIYSKMKLFIKKNTNENEIESEVGNKGYRMASLRLEKIKPPKFSGEIRDFARFKADFEAIVEPAYEDKMYLTYVLKETCLSAAPYELVKNLESVEEIWKRLEEKYGDTIEIVDSVI